VYKETEVNGKFHIFPHIIVMPTETANTAATLLAAKSIPHVASPSKLQTLLILVAPNKVDSGVSLVDAMSIHTPELVGE
jgi:hypothetical protein